MNESFRSSNEMKKKVKERVNLDVKKMNESKLREEVTQYLHTHHLEHIKIPNYKSRNSLVLRMNKEDRENHELELRKIERKYK
jgi:hypothetical protein